MRLIGALCLLILEHPCSPIETYQHTIPRYFSPQTTIRPTEHTSIVNNFSYQIPITIMSASSVEFLNMGPVEAKESFAQQFDLNRPDQAMSSYQKYVLICQHVSDPSTNNTSGSCTSTPSNNSRVRPLPLVVAQQTPAARSLRFALRTRAAHPSALRASSL